MLTCLVLEMALQRPNTAGWLRTTGGGGGGAACCHLTADAPTAGMPSAPAGPRLNFPHLLEVSTALVDPKFGEI